MVAEYGEDAALARLQADDPVWSGVNVKRLGPVQLGTRPIRGEDGRENQPMMVCGWVA